MGNNGLYSFTASIIGFILIFIIMYRQRKISMKLLSFFLFTLAVTNFLCYLFESRKILEVPFLFRVGPFINYLTAPSLFLYVLFELNIKRKLKWGDVLHLLPAVLFLVDYFPLFVSNNDHKKQIIQALFQKNEFAFLFQEGWLLPTGTHFLLRHMIALIYVFFMVLSVIKLNSYAEKKLLKNQQRLNWIVLLVCCFFIFSIVGIVTYFYANSYFIWSATIWAPLITFSILCLFLLFKPNILYGIDTNSTTGITSNSEHAEENSKQLILPEEISFKLQASLHDFLEKKEYLRKNIKIGNVAEELDVQTYILSAYINQVYQMHFNDFINWFRIQFIVDGLKNENWHQLTLEAIADKAGFSNRTTFLTAFKKFMGMTPTAFLQKTKNEFKSKNKSLDNDI